MKKIYLLVATALLLASCVDDKESAVVDDIRKGKVEQLAAQTELAKAQAEAAKVLAEAEKLKAENEASKIAADKEIALKKAQTEQLLAEAEVKVKEAQAKLLEAQAAKTQAEAEVAQAEAGRLQAEAEKLKADAEKVQAEMEQIKAETAARQEKLAWELKNLAADYEQKLLENELQIEKIKVEVAKLKTEADAAKEEQLSRYYANYYAALQEQKMAMVKLAVVNAAYFELGQYVAKSIDEQYQVLTDNKELAAETLEESKKELAEYKEGIKPAQASAEEILKVKKEDLKNLQQQLDANQDSLVRASAKYCELRKKVRAAWEEKNKAKNDTTAKYSTLSERQAYVTSIHGTDFPEPEIRKYEYQNGLVNYNPTNTPPYEFYTSIDENGAEVQLLTIGYLNYWQKVYKYYVDNKILHYQNNARKFLADGFYLYFHELTPSTYTRTYAGEKYEATYMSRSYCQYDLRYPNVKYNRFVEAEAGLKGYTNKVNAYDKQISDYEAKIKEAEDRYNKLIGGEVDQAITDANAKAKAYDAAVEAEKKAKEAIPTQESVNKLESEYNTKNGLIAGLTTASKTDADAYTAAKNAYDNAKKEYDAITDKTTDEAKAKALEVAGLQTDAEAAKTKADASAKALADQQKIVSDAKTAWDNAVKAKKEAEAAYKKAQEAAVAARKAYNDADQKAYELKQFADDLSRESSGIIAQLKSSLEAVNYVKENNNQLYREGEACSSKYFNYPDFVKAIEMAKTNKGGESVSSQGNLDNINEQLKVAKADSVNAQKEVAIAETELKTSVATFNEKLAAYEKALDEMNNSEYAQASSNRNLLNQQQNILGNIIGYYERFLEKGEDGAAQYSEDVIKACNEQIEANQKLYDAAVEAYDAFDALSEEEKMASLDENDIDYIYTTEFAQQLKAIIDSLKADIDAYQAEANRWKEMINNY